ncbi:MAG: glycosyltransferase family 2 protein [Pseudomonadota bacterium]
MSRPTVSVTLASPARSDQVLRALMALKHLAYPSFEVVFVGHAPDLDAYDLPDEIAQAVHYVPSPGAALPAQRNIGLRAARGEVVAFLADDGVPEPDWLDHLAMAFVDPEIGLAGGRVRAGDGVAYRFEGAWSDLAGQETPFRTPEAARLASDAARFPVLRATNCAFRRPALMEIGGFDESAGAGLDVLDAARRLGGAGWMTGWLPEAEVYQEVEPSYDAAERAAALAYFIARHTPEAEQAAALDQVVARMGEHAAIQEGRHRAPKLPLALTVFDRLILPFGARLPDSRLSLAVLSGPSLRGSVEMRGIARALTIRGHRVAFFNTRAPRSPKSVKFSDGFWVHEGFEEGNRDVYRVLTGRPKPLIEVSRLANQRHFDAVLRPSAWDLWLDREGWLPLKTALEPNLRVHLLREKEGLMAMIRDEVTAAMVEDAPNAIPIPTPPRPTSPGRRSATVSSR